MNTTMTKEKIIGMSANDNHIEGMYRIKEFLRNETSKSQLMDLLGMDKKTIGEYTHENLVDKVMKEALKGEIIKWNDIADTFELDNVRICSLCGQPMVAGVFAAADYYCSDECLDKAIGIDTYMELSKNADDEDCEYYYTEW